MQHTAALITLAGFFTFMVAGAYMQYRLTKRIVDSAIGPAEDTQEQAA
ncbi:hypothetical protein [Cupriavidus sp. USMAA2-4]|nr:hypothetical protein [Cupriavidus sp. USMAA2-4]